MHTQNHQNPLAVAGRMTRKAAELFRKDLRPGFAIFADVGGDAVEQARGIAAQAAADDRAAAGMLDQVLADGVVTAGEVQLLRRARGRVLRSAGRDAQLAGGAV